MFKYIPIIAAAGLLGACATTTPYGPAERDGAKGYMVQPIESNRFRVSYRDGKAETARDNALRRAAEVTLENNADWFLITNAYDDFADANAGRSGTSVSIGGATGSSGRTSVGVGLGIGFGLGNSTGPVTHVIEMVTGEGETPDDPQAYTAQDVLINLAGVS